ncbi:MAG: DUF2318 domain-containing protein [Synergistaceae bacterium]|nr:DUF2318 domain-containing protein [Synergistaceae bacterium]
MNLILIAFNRRLIIFIAANAILALSFALILSFNKFNKNLNLIMSLIFAALIFAGLTYLTPPLIQFTQEFVYFGEAGISTNSLLRALGYALGLGVCLLLVLSAFKVHEALSIKAKFLFLACSLLIFVIEFGAKAVLALRNLRLIPRNDLEFFIRLMWSQRGQYPDTFIYLQLILALIMLAYVILTHRKPEGEFANKALLRKEKARLRNYRRWSWSLFAWEIAAVFILIVLHYYDTRPPAEVQPEPYELNNNIITIDLAQVSDGHLHKFSYVTPNKYDVRFLVVKKPAGTAYGLGLDACDICGIAGYYERGNDEVVCRRCDVVMNKNTIGFMGGCNPVPFEYEIKNSKIYIDTQELIKHELRFR